MLKKRIISAAIGLPFVVIIFWFGEPWFTLLLVIAAVFACSEFYRLVVPDKDRWTIYFGLAWSALLVSSPHITVSYSLSSVITIMVVFSLLWVFLFIPQEKAFSYWAWIIAGIFYTGWMLSSWVALRGLTDGRYWALQALFVTFAYDSSAFFTGRTLGKHLLAPKISPGKTWEGAIGGLTGAVVASLILKNLFPLPVSYGQALLLGFLISLFSQLGDLVESLLKRGSGVKDSGKLIPGHGGVLDRIDSLIFTGPAVYYFVTWVMV